MADRVQFDQGLSAKMAGQIVQKLGPALRGEATTAIRRGAYQQGNAFMARRIRVAADIARTMTQRKYPNAKEREESRRPVPGAPHLEDSWTYTLPSSRGGARLVNTRPQAAMLLLGISKPSSLSPQGVAMVFPKRPQNQALSSRTNANIRHRIVRPVPVSQTRVPATESIPYLAIRASIRQGRRA